MSPRRPAYPTRAVDAYRRVLLHRVEVIHRATMIALRPHLDDAPAPHSTAAVADVLAAADSTRRADAIGAIAVVTRIIEAIRAVFGAGGTFAPKVGDVAPIGRQVDLFAADQLNRAIGSAIVRDSVPRVGIQVASPIVTSWATDNIALIKSIDSVYFDSIRKIVLDGYHAGTPTAELARMLEDRYDVTRSRAKFIARDQVAKLNGQVSKARQTRLGITSYKWSTSHDQRVRDNPDGGDHASLDGKVFDWSDPPIVDHRTGRREHPGGDYQCRCVAIPILPAQYR